ncbi:MAG TPA: (2Fe-2S)-binding protein [Candidatus Binataceae bacterium]|nr:(2Fe-2S)-binding protein [Candidatus Binataceae bacterium]
MSREAGRAGTTLHLKVNGTEQEVTVDYYDTPLLYVLRDDLKLKGVRFGCGVGQCGACTVMIDGRAVKSCETPAWSVEGQGITTIEGLGTIDRMHPLQQAIVDFQAGQCGYCLAGILMRTAALVGVDKQPSREKLVAALDDNLCRCGAHSRILDALEGAWIKLAAGDAK